MSGIYSIEDLRRSAPAHLRNASDDRLIHEYSKNVGMDPRDVAKYLGAKTGDDSGVLRSGLSSGLDQLQGLGYSALGGIADAVGFDRGRDWANNRADFNQTQAYLSGKPELERIEDQTLGSAPAFAGYQIAKQVPMIAGVLGAQLIPGAGQASSALGLSRLGAVAPRIMGGGGYTAGAGHAAGRAALAQGETFGTSMLAGSGIGYGALYQESVDGGNPSPYLSMLGAPVYGAAEALVPAAVRGALRAPGQFSGNLLTRMGKAGGLASLGEAGTELTQNELEMQMYGYDQLTPEDRASRRLNSAVIGGLVGGSLGTVGGIRGPQTVDEGEFDLTNRQAEPRPLGIVRPASDVPLQDQINQRVGIGGTPVAGKDYAKQFTEAFNEPSGEWVIDPATGLERELTVGEATQRLNNVSPSAAEPVVNPEVQQLQTRLTELVDSLTAKGGVDDSVVQEMGSITQRLKELQTQGADIGQGTEPPAAPKSALTESDEFYARELKMAVPQGKKRRDVLERLYDDAVKTGIPVEHPALEDYWQAISAGSYFGGNQQAKLRTLLQNALADYLKAEQDAEIMAPEGVNAPKTVAQPGDFNVSGTGVAAPAAARSSGQPSPVVDRSVGDSGPDAAVGLAAGGPAAVDGAPAGPADVVAAPVAGPAAPVKLGIRRAGETKSSVVQPKSELTEQEENELEIARLTGSADLADVLEAGASGQRADVVDTVLTPEQREDVLTRRFADIKDPEKRAQARQILDAYLEVAKDAPRGFVGKTHDAIGKDFGIGKDRVEQIANVAELIRAGEAAGFTPEQIENTFGVARRGHSTRSDGTGPVEGEVEAADREAYAALRSAGLEFEEGETSGFGSTDDSRQWQKDSSAGNPEGDRLIRHSDHIQRLREGVEKLQAKGLTNAAATVEQMVEREQKKADELRAALEKKATPVVPKRDVPAELKAAKEKFKANQRNVSKMERAELELLRDEAVRFKNQKLLDEIEAALGVEPTKLAPVERKKDAKPKAKAAKKAEPKDDAVSEVEPILDEDQYLPPSEQAKRAWDAVAKTNDLLPTWGSLDRFQQEEFIDFGPDNWTRADVIAFAQNTGARFSKAKAKTAKPTKNTVERILNTMQKAFKATFGDHRYQDFVQVHQTAEEAFAAVGKKVPMNQLWNAQAFVDPRDNRVVHLIADNIPAGHEFAVLLHEVGVHVGLKGELGAMFKALEAQVKAWGDMPKSSLERQVHDAAMARVAAGRLEGSIKASDAMEELVAYAAEEAVARGVKPEAGSRNKLERWMAQLKRAFQRAMSKHFGFTGNYLPNLSAQDLVTLSFAAASAKMTETRREVGASPDANDMQVMRYYAATDRGHALHPEARLEEWSTDEEMAGFPGAERFSWGPGSKYGPHANITTEAFPSLDPEDNSREFTMFITSAQSVDISEATGEPNDAALQVFYANEDPDTGVWAVSVYGPHNDGRTFKKLKAEGKASSTPDGEGREWTRLEGVPMRDTLRALTEFRRRLTRILGGRIPHADWTRATGVSARSDKLKALGGRDGEKAPDEVYTRFSKVSQAAKPGANVVRLAKLLGPKLYGSPADIVKVSVKEILQNSFDAIKGKIAQTGQPDADWMIDIRLDEPTRTIKFKDNGTGMSPNVLGGQFLQIAGTNKESDNASGGLGIAKMLFLYGNESLDVTTMRDGKIARLSTSGEQLMQSLDGGAEPPNVDIYTPKDAPELAEMFPDGHGTVITVKVPKTYTDPATGEVRDIAFPTTSWDFPVLENSPLFAPIDVKVNNWSVDIGVEFPAHKFTTFANVEFEWGTARIYVSKDPYTGYGSNAHVLSNGLWQFSKDIKTNPMDFWGGKVPRKFYIDVHSKVRPEDAGYPFDLSRQKFSESADTDMGKIFNYISALYRAEDIGDSAKDFGVTQYLARGRDGKVTATAEEKLMPEIPQTGVLAAIKEGDSVEVKDGRLIVNGRQVPELTREDLGKSQVDIDSLRIDQSSIDPKKVMLHDNLLVPEDAAELLDLQQQWNEKRKEANALFDEYSKIVKERDRDPYGEVTFAQVLAAHKKFDEADNAAIALNDRIMDLRNKKSDPVPISEAARRKFGQRFDDYAIGVGELFQTLRNKLVEVMGPEYAPLADEAIGVSFDQEYRGVSVKLPFAGMFINPAVPEYTDPVRAAYGMFGTMVHELAHFRVRNHGAEFAAEMQRIAINLEASDLDIAKLKRDFVEHVRKHAEVLNWLHEQNTDNRSKPRGRRFKDGDQQSRLPGNAGSVAGPGQAARSAQGVSGGPQAGAGSGPQGGQRAAGNAPNQRAAAAVRQPPSRSTIERNVAKLPKPAQQPVRNTVNGFNDILRKGLDRVVFTHTLIQRATKAGMKSAEKFYELLAARSNKVREHERRVEKISDMYAGIEAKDKGNGPRSLNQFLFESTRQGKWGYGKDRDAEMGDWFDELGPKSQEMVKAILAHGDAVLAEKKQTILDYTNSEFDALIAAAQIAGNTDMVKELKQDKANSLKKYQTLFKIHEGKPYAPIKRMGNHVVLAKSAEYREAEANDNKKRMRELEVDPDHYHVSFTDTKNEARNLAARLLEQGHFGTDPEAVTFFERSAENEDAFGSSTLRGLTALRSRVDDRSGKGRSELQRMVNDMWLNALAESSARKSETRRRGISGEVDMLRSFSLQGRADAQFMASVEYAQGLEDALRDLDNEVKAGGDRDRKSQLRNEIVERYNRSLELSPNPLVNKVTRLSSIYFLASSPMYYLQNATQPWMMSLPAMTAKHDYTKASKALLKAYGDLGPMIKAFKWSSQFDFTKAPDDVKKAVQELVLRGRIDIGLDTELGEFRIEGSGAFANGWNKLDKVLRLMVQKGEAINRLSTGIAAYRLELARTNNREAALKYADEILLETHGDYGRFNANKYFNTDLGRVALQFRKFQLIQLTFYAKMFKDAFAGATPGEKAAARKVLAFAMGHMGLAAGMMGIPGYHAVAFLLGTVLGSDDEPYDLTFELRKLIGNEDLANVIMRGAPTMVGADISHRVGAGTMLSIMPFSKADLTTPSGQAEALGTLLGGASLGMTMRGLDGLGLMLSGDWMRGAELVLPKGLGDAIKGARFGSEGMTRRNGDVLLSADEISFAEAFMTSIGMSPVQTSVTYERRNRQFEMDKNFQDRSSRVKNQYVKAHRNRDTEGMREAREAWQKLQEARVRNGYTRQPMSNLLKAPQEQAKRERGTVAGVQTNRSNAGFAEAQTSI